MNQQTYIMKTMTQFVVQIGDPVNRTFYPAFEIDAHALLWASAKGRDFIPAIATIGRKSYQNGPLREESLPDARKYPVLRERIGYWETALTADDPALLLRMAVKSALNSFCDLIGTNPLAAAPHQFVPLITQSACEWAKNHSTPPQS